jgi:ABC-type polysaccharide/polyol phosphate export permease
MIERYKKYKFLFSVLVHRDFNKKYKRTVLGAIWSLLSPLMVVLAQGIIFTQFFGRNQPHFIVYIFIGNMIFHYFSDATKSGMAAIESNAGIITKIRVPKYLFIFTKNITSLINLGLTLTLLIVFCLFDRVAITWRFILIIYPIVCLTIFNIGAGLLLSGIYVFFRDTRYFYDIFCMIIMYFSAIFYTIDGFSEQIQWLFNVNPVFTYISYVRKLVISAQIPSLQHTVLCAVYAVIMLGVGCLMYYKKNKGYVFNL